MACKACVVQKVSDILSLSGDNCCVIDTAITDYLSGEEKPTFDIFDLEEAAKIMDEKCKECPSEK